jgi:hypothetical protein
MRSAPRLSVTASPSRIIVARELNRETHVSKVRFRMYANYGYYIDRAEVRVFEVDQSLESEPLDVVDVGPDGFATWQPPAAWFTAPVRSWRMCCGATGRMGTSTKHARSRCGSRLTTLP